jgi:hypothetical protein
LILTPLYPPEQESLITRLKTENTTRNKQYTLLFLALPSISALLYLPALSAPSTSLLSLLALSSLAISAWTLYSLPPNKTGFAAIDSLINPKAGTTESRVPQLGQIVDKGPLELYLPFLNLGLIGILFLGGLVLKEGKAWPGFGLLPGAVSVFVVGAKWVMGSVDVGELEDLKYGYKGA